MIRFKLLLYLVMPACEGSVHVRQLVLEEARRCPQLNGACQGMGRVELGPPEN